MILLSFNEASVSEMHHLVIYIFGSLYVSLFHSLDTTQTLLSWLYKINAYQLLSG